MNCELRYLLCLRRRTQIERSPRTDAFVAFVATKYQQISAICDIYDGSRFRGGAGGCRCCRHSRSCSPLRQGGGRQQASPTTTRHVLPISDDIVVTPFVGANDENDITVAPPQGSEFFEDVYDGDYDDGLQNKEGEDCITPGSAVLRPRQTWGGA